MKDSYKQFQEAFEELYTLTISNKMRFLEALLFYFTISGRGIWSDENSTDAEKVEAYKWLNELLHRIWNIHFELQKGEDKESITRLYENMKFYSEQSDLLRKQLVSTVLGAFDNFKSRI
jgi:hypothetical protein